jgi:predicted ATPase/DNA-binding SARP family transcriptional activator
VRVGILGPLIVVGDDGPIDLGGARLRTLLIRLALEPGRTVGVDRLATALWSDDPPADQANALQSLVSRLRRALPDATVITSSPVGYQLSLPATHVDASEFEQLARDGRRLLEAGDATQAARVLTQALALWRGAALADAAEAGFAVASAARLEQLRLAATEDRIEADLALGRHGDVVSELDTLSGEHPLRERLRGLQLRALYGAGRQAEALTAYDETRRQLADELGVDPSPALQKVHLAVLRGDPELTAAPAVPPARETPRTNLRTALTSFVGREAEIERIGELLGRSRLLTLVGPGGAGKTRLATEVAASLAEGGADGSLAFEDGAWLVELAPVSDPADIAQAVLGSLTLREKRMLDNKAPTGPRDALNRLVDAFSTGSALLVLDNCEHLIDGAAHVADYLLGRCPDLRILTTSREPLGIFGETLCPVPSLGLPAADATVDEALTHPAVQLLVDRATAVRPSFAVDTDNVAAVIEICRRLDGLPLAIELAAARLRALTVQQVADRLEDRFRLLTGGSRTAVARHQTLRAVVAWSWDLLSDEERHLADRLAVFTGGATAESAEDICAGDDIRPDDVLDLLTALADKSLVQVVAAGQPRYRMLETIREYGVERLADQGHITPLRAAHAAHFLGLAEAADPQLRGPDQIEWIDRLTADRDNVLAALRFAADIGDAETAVRIAAAMSWFWVLQGSFAEAHAWLSVALSVPGEPDPDARAVALVVRGLSGFASGQGDMTLAKAKALVDNDLGGLDGTRGHPILAFVAPGTAMLADDTEAAIAAVDRNLSHPDPWAKAALLMLRAAVAENAGDIELLRKDAREAHERFAAIGDRWGMATTLSSIAWVRMIDGDLDGAVDAYTTSIDLVTQLRASDDVSEQLLRLSLVRARQGDLDGARRDVLRAHTLAEERRSALMLAFSSFVLGEVDRLSGDLVSARRRQEQALADFEAASHGPPQVKAIAMVGLANLDLADGDVDSALDLLRQGLDIALGVRDMPVAAVAAAGFAQVSLAFGDPTRAATVLGTSTALRGTADRSDPDVARVAAAAREALGPEAYEEAYSRGVSMSRDEALALLDEPPGSGPSTVGAHRERREHRDDG